jgi:hypothetical protein
VYCKLTACKLRYCGPGDLGRAGEGPGRTLTAKPQARPNQEPESKPESDRARVPESESKEESDLLWTRESESKDESNWLWTQEPESKEESENFVTQEPESTGEPDSVGPGSPMDSRVRIQKKMDSVCCLGYGWTGHKSSSDFSDLAPSILHCNWF